MDKPSAQSEINDAVSRFLASGGRISRLAEKDPAQAQSDFYEARRNRTAKQRQKYKRG